MIDGRFRATFEKGLRPVGRNIKKSGMTADHFTLLGGLMAVCCAVSLGFGNLRLGFLFGLLSAVPDVLDGAVAKASGTAGPRGAFFDSVMDRVSDALILGGLAFYLAGSEAYGHYWPMLPMAVLATSMLISYERARAEALGFNAKGGLMERAERLIALGIGVLFEMLLIPVLFVMLALTLVTAVQRFVKVWRQASIERPASPRTQRRVARRRSTRATRSRWSERQSDIRGAFRARRPPDRGRAASTGRGRAGCLMPHSTRRDRSSSGTRDDGHRDADHPDADHRDADHRENAPVTPPIGTKPTGTKPAGSP